MDYWIGLGSNLGDRAAHLGSALGEFVRVDLAPAAQSSVWETEPVGICDPNWFFNMVALVRSERTPSEILGLLQGLERCHGRDRSENGGARTLDLDLLLADAIVLELPDLVVPHPRLWDRSFVLEPLAEIASDLTVPGRRATIGERARELRGRGPVARRLGPIDALAPRQAIPL